MCVFFYKLWKKHLNLSAAQTQMAMIAAAASEPEASELGSILFGAWRSKNQNAKHYGW